MHIFAQPNMNLIEVMKENKYDDDRFFSQYAQMSRSVEGLQGAGEWHILQKMLPDFTDKRVLDLGCGFAGTVSMPLNMEQSMLQELIFPGRCWKKLKKEILHHSSNIDVWQSRISTFNRILMIS